MARLIRVFHLYVFPMLIALYIVTLGALVALGLLAIVP